MKLGKSAIKITFNDLNLTFFFIGLGLFSFNCKNFVNRIITTLRILNFIKLTMHNLSRFLLKHVQFMALWLLFYWAFILILDFADQLIYLFLTELNVTMMECGWREQLFWRGNFESGAWVLDKNYKNTFGHKRSRGRLRTTFFSLALIYFL